MSVDLKETIVNFVRRVKDLSEHVRGNEQATKQSLVGPLFSLLGYDLTDPRECLPEYKTDFGIGRSVKPVDWAFMSNGKPVFFVEAKEAGKKLSGYSEQLGDYFAKSTDVKLGILTNGVQWKFYTDVDHSNVMDKEPFVTWDVLSDEEPPIDLLTVLHKSQYNPQLIRTFAERNRNRNLLVNELAKLLEPSSELVRLAVANIETRRMTDAVVEGWKPVLASAIEEWARQRTLHLILNPPKQPEAPLADRVVTTQEELKAFEAIKAILGSDRPAGYQDTYSYFKIHLPERQTWAFARVYLDRRAPMMWIGLDYADVKDVVIEGVTIQDADGWIEVPLRSLEDLNLYGDLLKAAWDKQRLLHPLKI